MKKRFYKYSSARLQRKPFHFSLMGLALVVGLTACKKQLEEHPKSMAVETYYNTAAEVRTAVDAIYPPLRSTNIQGSYISELAPYVDYGDARGSFGVLNDFQGLNATHISRTDQAWTNFYLSIRNANLVIANAPNGKEISQADVQKFVAEAKFIRAFDYFHLVRSWGGIPLHTEANLKEVDIPKSTPSEVYDLIVSDLKDAETNLPDVSSPAGKPTRWSAKSVLADVYLQQGKYADARDKAAEVINSNKYALVPVKTVDDWQKVFGADAGVTTEEVFYIENLRQPGYGNIWPMYLNHPGTKLLKQGGWYGFHSYTTNPVYANQDDNDLRKGLWYSWNIGMGPTTILNKKFIDPLATNGAGNPMTWYRYADVLLIYAEAASRANNGPTTEAMEALNKVHRRAYGKDPNQPSSVDFDIASYNADTFLDLVIREYGYEFQYEGKRWLELKRTGKAQEIIMATKGKTIAEKNYLFPIPASEFNFNKALDPTKDQNPGY